LTNRQIERIFASLNKSGTDLISYEDFLAALKVKFFELEACIQIRFSNRADLAPIKNLLLLKHSTDWITIEMDMSILKKLEVTF